MSDHWYPDIGWEDSADGDYFDVVAVHIVRGPAPFDGLRARDDEHAQEVCDALNEAFGRTVPDAVEREPEPPTPIAASLAETIEAEHDGVEVSASGNTVTLTGKRTGET